MKRAKPPCLWILFLAFFILFPLSTVRAEEEVIWDVWSVIRMSGEEVGWAHEIVTRQIENGHVHIKADSSSEMEIKRFGQSVFLTAEGWTLEDENGRILKMHQETLLSGQKTVQDLEVKGNEAVLTLTTMGTPRASTIPWEDDVRGSFGTWMLRREKGWKPKTKYSFKSFVFDFGRIFTTTTKIIGKEEVELLDGETASLCHSVSTSDILPGVKSKEWFNEKFDTLKTSTNLMGITIETYHTGKERAMRSRGGELKKDMLIQTMAQANVNLPSPYQLDSILYRFKAKDPELGLPKELEDFRQHVVESNGQEALVRISAVAPERLQKRPLTEVPEELREYMEPNAYIQCDHPGLKAKALEVVGNETDAWKAACLLEHFVFEYIADKNMGTGFASAAEVFENPTGDCSEHGVLLAAVCRAAGIPSRVVIGYMYLGGIFGGHMWAEVWINGEWYPIDGVMGIGRVDPTHIKFSDSSLKNEGLGEAFISAVTALGNLEITILEFTRGEKTVKVGKQFRDYLIDGDTYTNTLYGISIAKPKGYEFEGYERDFSKPEFTLVEMDGESNAELLALPASFSFSMDELREKWSKGESRILSEFPRKVCGRNSRLFLLKEESAKRATLVLLDKDTCYLLTMRIEEEEEERDMATFESMVKSIRFTGLE